MKLVTVLLVALCLLFGSLQPAGAQGIPLPGMVSQSFRLQITGGAFAGDTYWVAYGPLGGRFGIFQLHAAGHGLYRATRLLPAGRTSFTYLAGHGVIHARFGPAPGNPVTTIRTVTAVIGTRLPLVHWHAPLG